VSPARAVRRGQDRAAITHGDPAAGAKSDPAERASAPGGDQRFTPVRCIRGDENRSSRAYRHPGSSVKGDVPKCGARGVRIDFVPGLVLISGLGVAGGKKNHPMRKKYSGSKAHESDESLTGLQRPG
jgi:hypothetical protein